MRIEGYGSAHPGLIEETEFCGSNLLSPYSGNLGTGILIVDNKYTGSNITIGNGNVLSTSSGYNSFHDLRYGIQMDVSTVTVQNNYFYDIITSSANGYAIYGTGEENELSVRAYIGETGIGTSYSNAFENCNRGVYLNNFYHSEIHANHFLNDAVTSSSSVMENGIRISGCPNLHNISYNRLRNVNNTGVFMMNNGVAEMHINNNKVTSTLNLSFTVLRRGIAVANTFSASADVYIDLNVLENMAVSISTLNLNGETFIRGNAIDMVFNSGTWPSRGILAENCPDVLIDVLDPTGTPVPNVITGYYSSGCEDEIIRIDIQSSEDFRCYRNVVNNCYPGIRAEGSCAGGNFVCNVLDACEWGFGLKNLDNDPIQLGVGTTHEIFGGYYLGGGTTELPSDNQWKPSSGSTSTWANRTHAYNTTADWTNGPDLLWYYRDFQNEWDMEPTGTLNTDDFSSVAIPTGSLINTGGVDPDIVPLCSFPMPRIEEEQENESILGSSEFANSDSLFYAKMSAYFADILSAESADAIMIHLNEEGAYILPKSFRLQTGKLNLPILFIVQ